MYGCPVDPDSTGERVVILFCDQWTAVLNPNPNPHRSASPQAHMEFNSDIRPGECPPVMAFDHLVSRYPCLERTGQQRSKRHDPVCAKIDHCFGFCCLDARACQRFAWDGGGVERDGVRGVNRAADDRMLD